ncbi:hypothetical protein Tco_0014534 [Tanacetum coccineum]
MVAIQHLASITKSRELALHLKSLRHGQRTVPIAGHTLGILEVFLTLNILFAQHVRNVSLMTIHVSCVSKFLNEVNSHATVPSNKTTKRYIPIEQTSFSKKPERQIPKRHRSSIKKTSVMHEKTMTHRSCLRWKPTGIIFKTVGPEGKNVELRLTNTLEQSPTGCSNDVIEHFRVLLFSLHNDEWAILQCHHPNSTEDTYKDGGCVPHSAGVGVHSTCSMLKLQSTYISIKIQESLKDQELKKRLPHKLMIYEDLRSKVIKSTQGDC